MMNALHLLRMKVNKIEGCLSHTMNAPINIIWSLNIWQCSMWCFYSSFNLLIGAAGQMQPWVSLLTFPIILSMYLLINVTLLSYTINKDSKFIYNSVVWRFTANDTNCMRFSTYWDEITDHVVCLVWRWSARSYLETGGMVLEYVLGMLYFLHILLIFKNCQCLDKRATAMICTWNC